MFTERLFNQTNQSEFRSELKQVLNHFLHKLIANRVPHDTLWCLDNHLLIYDHETVLRVAHL